MQTSARVALNTITGWGAKIVDGALQIWLVKFLLAELGQEAFGLTGVLTSLVALTMVADLGLGTALSRQLAAHVAKNDARGVNLLASTAMAIYLGIGTVVWLALGLFSAPITAYFEIESAVLDDAILLIRWYGGALLFLSFVEPVFRAVLMARNRFDVINAATIATSLLRGLGVLLIVGLTPLGLWGWAIASLSGIVARVGITMFYAKRLWTPLALRTRYVAREACGALLSLGGFLWIAQFTRVFVQNMHPFILTKLLGLGAVAIYRPGLALSGAFRPFVMALSQQMHPLATQYFVSDDRSRLHALLLRGTRFTFLLGIPICVLLGVFADSIAYVWLSDELPDGYRVTALVILIWAAIDLSSYAEGSQWPVLLGMHRVGFILWLDLPLAIASVVASVLLVWRTDWGIIGVAIPSLVTEVIRRIILTAYTARVSGVGIRTYLRQAYIGPTLVLAGTLAGALIARFALPSDSLLTLLLVAIQVGVVWMALAWWVGLTHSDRQLVLMLAPVRKVLGKLPGRRAAADPPSEQGP